MDYQLLESLHQAGARNTPQRQIIFQALKSAPAITTSDLRAQVSGRLDTASLYRTLSLFREIGIIQDVVIAGQRKIELTDRFSPHHHHLACRGCGATVTIHDDTFEATVEQLATRQGFTHESHSFEITGVCSDCSRARQPLRANHSNN